MKRKKKMGRCVTQSEFNNKSCHVISHTLFYYYNNIIHAYIYHYRPQTSLIQMWFWISCVILVCWRRWRSAELDFRCAARLKISSAGVCACENTLRWCVFFQTLCFILMSVCVRYKIILKEKEKANMCSSGDEKKNSTDLLMIYDRTKKEWQLGKSKVSHPSTLISFSLMCVCVVFDGNEWPVITFDPSGVSKGTFRTEAGETKRWSEE